MLINVFKDDSVILTNIYNNQCITKTQKLFVAHEFKTIKKVKLFFVIYKIKSDS